MKRERDGKAFDRVEWTRQIRDRINEKLAGMSTSDQLRGSIADPRIHEALPSWPLRSAHTLGEALEGYAEWLPP